MPLPLILFWPNLVKRVDFVHEIIYLDDLYCVRGTVRITNISMEESNCYLSRVLKGTLATVRVHMAKT